MPARSKTSIFCRRLHLLIAIASFQSFFTATLAFGQATEWHRDPSNITNYAPKPGEPPPSSSIHIHHLSLYNYSPPASAPLTPPTAHMHHAPQHTHAYIHS